MSAVLSSSKEVPNAELEIVRLTGHIGAQVQGIRLSGNLPADIFKSIQSALYAHKVLFFRNQEHLDDAAHQEFGRLWGPLEDHPTVPSRDGTRIFELDSQHGGRANSWHTDVTFEVAPPQVSILRAVVLPTVGGDTVWANTAYAYAELSPSLKSLAEELWAIHSNDYDYAATRVEPDPAGVKRFREVFKRRLIQSEHPLVRVHPVTGERTLVAGHFLKKFIGYNTQDSNHL
ncbi:MAG: TauD/TfdA family dioxygenase, partial [Burkholderiaceae bacterium]